MRMGLNGVTLYADTAWWFMMLFYAALYSIADRETRPEIGILKFPAVESEKAVKVLITFD